MQKAGIAKAYIPGELYLQQSERTYVFDLVAALDDKSEEIAHQIVTRWKWISENVDKEFMKDFCNYHIEEMRDRIYVSQTWFIRKGPLHFIDALHR